MDFKIKMLVDYKHLRKDDCLTGSIQNAELDIVYVDTCLLNWNECALIHNFDKFVVAYAKEINKDMHFNPDEWAIQTKPLELAYRMALGLRCKSANLSNTAKKACRKLGIKPTYKGVEEYLA